MSIARQFETTISLHYYLRAIFIVKIRKILTKKVGILFANLSCFRSSYVFVPLRGYSTWTKYTFPYHTRLCVGTYILSGEMLTFLFCLLQVNQQNFTYIFIVKKTKWKLWNCEVFLEDIYKKFVFSNTSSRLILFYTERLLMMSTSHSQ